MAIEVLSAVGILLENFYKAQSDKGCQYYFLRSESMCMSPGRELKVVLARSVQE